MVVIEKIKNEPEESAMVLNHIMKLQKRSAALSAGSSTDDGPILPEAQEVKVKPATLDESQEDINEEESDFDHLHEKVAPQAYEAMTLFQSIKNPRCLMQLPETQIHKLVHFLEMISVIFKITDETVLTLIKTWNESEEKNFKFFTLTYVGLAYLNHDVKANVTMLERFIACHVVTNDITSKPTSFEDAIREDPQSNKIKHFGHSYKGCPFHAVLLDHSYCEWAINEPNPKKSLKEFVDYV